jgi:hypothetical protein
VLSDLMKHELILQQLQQPQPLRALCSNPHISSADLIAKWQGAFLQVQSVLHSEPKHPHPVWLPLVAPHGG